MKLKLFIVSIFCWLSSSASHLVGGQIYYQHTDSNQYRITLCLYRDCFCLNCAPFGDPEYITIFSRYNAVFAQVAIPFPGSVQDTVPITDSCVIPDVCVEKAVYSTLVTLPDSLAPYTIVYQRCCWANAISNIAAPGNQGMTLQTVITGNNIAVKNSAPAFVTEVPVYSPINFIDTVSLLATDPDTADVLRYSLCNIYTGSDPTCPNPSPGGTTLGGCDTVPSLPPYSFVTYNTPYDSTNFLNNPSNSGNLTIDSVTGTLHFTPNSIGIFIVAACVKDYRNGVQMSETRRYFELYTTQCIYHTGISESKEETITVYPNPAESFISIKSADKLQRVTLTDMQGRVLALFSSASDFATVDVSEFSRGVYLLNIQTAQGNTTRKISLE